MREYGAVRLAEKAARRIVEVRELGPDEVIRRRNRERLLDATTAALDDIKRQMRERRAAAREIRAELDALRAAAERIDMRRLRMLSAVLTYNPGWRSRRQRSRAFARASAGGG